MWHNSNMKNRMFIGKHKLNYTGDQIEARYRCDKTGRYDGVHLYSNQGSISYTNSVSQVLKSALLASPNKTSSKSSSSSFDHSSCPQAMFQKKKQMTNIGQNRYSVPVSNTFNILGN